MESIPIISGPEERGFILGAICSMITAERHLPVGEIGPRTVLTDDERVKYLASLAVGYHISFMIMEQKLGHRMTIGDLVDAAEIAISYRNAHPST